VLTEKPWRFEAIVRLVLALVACLALGASAQLLLRGKMLPDATDPLKFYTLTGGAAISLVAALVVIGRQFTLENFALRAATFFSFLFVGLFLCGNAQGMVDPNIRSASLAGFAVQILSFQGVLIPLLVVFVAQHNLTFSEGFGFRNCPGRALLLGAIVALGITPVCLGLLQGLGALAEYFGIHLPQQDAVFVLQLATSWTHRIVFGIATVLVVPLAEEGLFRGVLYPKLKQSVPPSAALMVTSLLFAAIHFNLLSFLPLVVLAAGLTLLYEKTGNLLAPAICHGLFNGYNYYLLFQQQSPPPQ